MPSLLVPYIVDAQSNVSQVSLSLSNDTPSKPFFLNSTQEIQQRVDSLEYKLKLLEGQNGLPKEKDIWDKIQALSGLITGGLVAIITLLITNIYKKREMRMGELQESAEQKNNEQQIKISQIQTLQTFMPQLQSDDKRVVAAALKAISVLDIQLFKDLSVIFASEGGASALSDLTSSSNKKIARQAKETLASIFKNLKQAIVKINDKNGILIGSGFIVSPDGYIITAKHVVDRALDQEKFATVILRDKTYNADIVIIKSPFALLKIDVTDCIYLIMDEREPSLFDEIIIWHTHEDLGWVFGSGIITSIDLPLPDETEKFVASDIVVGQGAGGTPAVNQANHVVGMVYLIYLPKKYESNISTRTILATGTAISSFLKESLPQRPYVEEN
jgi:S1-C subfamily serine protease